MYPFIHPSFEPSIHPAIHGPYSQPHSKSIGSVRPQRSAERIQMTQPTRSVKALRVLAYMCNAVIHRYTQSYIYSNTDMVAYIHAYIHTDIHTFINTHTYIHTYRYISGMSWKYAWTWWNWMSFGVVPACLANLPEPCELTLTGLSLNYCIFIVSMYLGGRG